MGTLSLVRADQVAEQDAWESAIPAESIVLPIVLNDVPSGNGLIFLRGNEVFLRADDYFGLALNGVDAKARRGRIQGVEVIQLSSLSPSLAYRFDANDITLYLTVAATRFASQTYDLMPPNLSRSLVTGTPSAFLNYSGSIADNLFYTTAFEAGVQVDTILLYSSAFQNSQRPLYRGITHLMLDDVQRMRRYVIGDRAVHSGRLGGGRLIGGVSISREFSFQPEFIRMPLPGITGEVSTPSSAEVYVDGHLIHRESLQPGPFAFENIPGRSGFGSAEVRLRNGSGEEEILLLPYFLSSLLLAPGLQDYSYTGGMVREHYGAESWDYGEAAFVGRHRVGVTDWLTLGARAEATETMVSGGPEVSLLLPFGLLSVDGAVSHDEGVSGQAALLRFSYPGRTWSLHASLGHLSPEYVNLSLASQQERALVEGQASVGTRLGRRVSMLARYDYREYLRRGVEQTPALQTSIRMGRRTVGMLSLSHRLTEGDDVTQVFASVNHSLGDRTHASVTRQQTNERGRNRVDLSRTVPRGRGVGYRVQGQMGDSLEEGYRTAANLQYQWEHGRYGADFMQTDQGQSARASAAGGIVVAGRGVQFSQPVDGSYAVVDVGDIPDVRVYHRNQEVGKTNRNGRLLVTGLLPYQRSQIRIESADVPMDVLLRKAEHEFAPPHRGAALVTFQARRFQYQTGKIRVYQRNDIIIPRYGDLVVQAGGETYTSPVGQDGEVYFEHLPAGKHMASVRHDKGACQFQLEVPESTDAQVDLQRIICWRG